MNETWASIGVAAAISLVVLARSLGRRSMSGPVDGKRSQDWFVTAQVRDRIALEKDKEIQ